MTPAEARAALVAGLRAEGLKVAEIGQDVAPPCVYVKRKGSATEVVALAGGVRSIFAVHWIPVRGVEDPAGQDDAHAKILDACEPLAVEPVELDESSVTIGDQSWPCDLGLVVMF